MPPRAEQKVLHRVITRGLTFTPAGGLRKSGEAPDRKRGGRKSSTGDPGQDPGRVAGIWKRRPARDDHRRKSDNPRPFYGAAAGEEPNQAPGTRSLTWRTADWCREVAGNSERPPRNLPRFAGRRLERRPPTNSRATDVRALALGTAAEKFRNGCGLAQAPRQYPAVSTALRPPREEPKVKHRVIARCLTLTPPAGGGNPGKILTETGEGKSQAPGTRCLTQETAAETRGTSADPRSLPSEIRKPRPVGRSG